MAGAMPEGQQTVIEFAPDSDEASIWTSDPAVMAALARLGVRPSRRDSDDVSRDYEVPREWIHIGPPPPPGPEANPPPPSRRTVAASPPTTSPPAATTLSSGGPERKRGGEAGEADIQELRFPAWHRRRTPGANKYPVTVLTYSDGRSTIALPDILS